MKISRTQLVLNVLLALLICWSLVSLTRMTHSFPASMLMGFLPSASWALWCRSPENRTLGGVAVLLNCLLGITGLFTLEAFFLGAMVRASAFEQGVFFAFGIFLLAVGVLDTRAAWKAFPPKVKAS